MIGRKGKRGAARQHSAVVNVAAQKDLARSQGLREWHPGQESASDGYAAKRKQEYDGDVTRKPEPWERHTGRWRKAVLDEEDPAPVDRKMQPLIDSQKERAALAQAELDCKMEEFEGLQLQMEDDAVFHRSKELVEEVDSAKALINKLHKLKGIEEEEPEEVKPAKPGLIPRRRQGLDYCVDLFDPPGDSSWCQVVSVMAAIESGRNELVWSAVRKVGSRKINWVSAGDVNHHPAAPGHTPLTYAIQLGNMEIARLLVAKAGARVWAKNEYDEDALQVATRLDPMVDMLREVSGMAPLDRKEIARRERFQQRKEEETERDSQRAGADAHNRRTAGP